jgi:regulator of sigma E protease
LAIWANIQQTVTLLIILSILVVAHEWGHFIVARLCGIRVDDFSIGFGKRLFRIGKRGDTEYNVRMLPLGGFVKIAGMEPDEAPLVNAKDKVLGRDAQSDPDSHEIPLLAENLGENTPYSGPDGFYSKPLWQRSLVILAGPVMSFVLGYVVFCLMGVTTGIPTGQTLNKVAMTAPGGEGQRIGLRIGDVITAINGKTVTSGEQMVDLIHNSANKSLTLTVKRGSHSFTKSATPKPMLDDQNKPVMLVDIASPGVLGALGLQSGDTLGQINGTDVLSENQAQTLLQKSAGKSADISVLRQGDEVHLKGTLPDTVSQNSPTFHPHEIGLLNILPVREIKRVGLGASFAYGNQTVVETFQGLAYLIHRHELHKAAGGIIFMYQATGLAVKSGLPDVVQMLASLSISLAIFNLLPIPVLDGGHLLTFFIEWIRRGKRLTDQQQQAFLMTGLAIIGVLFVLIMSNDIIRTVTHQLPQ